MTDHSNKGRVFLAPPPKNELWVNIGWNVEGSQLYPEWVPQMEGAISKDDYDFMIARVKQCMDDNNMEEAAVWCCVFFVPIVGCCFMSARGHRITGHLKRICKDFPNARLELHHATNHVASPNPEHQAYDQFGKRLERSSVHVHVHGGGPTTGDVVCEALWPPKGYNIILTLPRHSNVRQTWTTPRVNTNLPGIPKTPSVYVAETPAIEAQVVKAPLQPEESGDVTSKLVKLKELLDLGLVTQKDYDKKKIEVLKRI